MKFIILLVLLFSSGAVAEIDIEYFDKAASGKHKVDFALQYINQRHLYSLVSNPSSEVEATASETSLKFDYGYGVSESIALHTKLAYTMGKVEERNSPANTNDEDNEISGLSDWGLLVIGNHETSPEGLFHWQLDLNYGLGNHTKKEKAAGPPAEYESNNYSGQTNLNLRLGYAHNIYYGNMGLIVASDVIRNKADVELKTLNTGNFDFEADGGKETSTTLIFEMPSEKILWGTALGLHWVEETKLKMNGSIISRDVAENFFKFSVYSRLDTGPGQELVVNFGYDINSKSGGDPASRKLEEGSAFTVSAAYSVEF